MHFNLFCQIGGKWHDMTIMFILGYKLSSGSNEI